jgi:hypothetical protein
VLTDGRYLPIINIWFARKGIIILDKINIMSNLGKNIDMVRNISNGLSCTIIFLISFTCLLWAQNGENVLLHFDPDRGFYESNFDLTLSTSPTGLTIRYTKDGTDPTTSSTAIQGISPIIIHVDPANTNGRDLAPGFCVRAVAIRADTAATKVKTHTYIFAHRVVELSPDGQRPGPGWLQQNFGSGQNINYGMDAQVCNDNLYRDKIVGALLDIPTFSMVMDLKDLFDPQTGIYVNALEHGGEWERPCSIELIYPAGTDGFQINCGVRIRGGWSRNDSNPKHAFRWFFRKEYGEGKLEYPMFGDEGVDEFDNIDLRTSMNYSWSYGAEDPSKNTMNRDVFSRDMQRDMGQPYTRSRYYHLYINGTYWGLYQTEERPEASYATSYFSGVPEDYDVVKVNAGYLGLFDIEATDGTLDAWKRLWDASMAGFETNEAYYKIQGLNPDGSRNPNYEVLLDVDNLIDFMLTVFLTGEADGPVSGFRNNEEPNNFFAIYNRNDDRGFIFFRHDAEHTLGAQPFGYDRTGPFPGGSIFKESNPQWIHQKLCENPLYVSRLADHVYLHFFNGGALTPQANIDRFLSRKEEIDLAIIAESARWGDSKHEPAFTRDNAWLPEINRIVEQFFPDRTNIVLGQLQSKGWYPRIDPPTFSSESGLVHVGFQLSMTASRGHIYYTTDGTDPCQPLEASISDTTFIPENATKKVIVPAAAIDSAWKGSTEFNDSDWQSGSGNVGYEQGSGYENIINMDVGPEMINRQTSCYVRIPFSVDQNKLASYNILTLRMYYDDGFMVWLNGEKVAEANTPASLVWNATATNNHEAEAWDTFDISSFVNKLLPGENLLAIQGLNIESSSSDFLIGTELAAGTAANPGEISENALPYTEPLVIDQTTCIKARVFDDVNWSAVHQATLWVLQGMENLRVSEIHYHPQDESDVDDDDGEYEFIELKNIGVETLDLSGIYFSRGIDYSFPTNVELNPDAFIVLASNKSAFFTRYAFQAFGEYTGQLDNSGETLALNSASGDTIIRIHYSDQYPWPESADGDGYSIVSREKDPYQDQNDAVNWLASGKIHGSPGCDDIAVSVEIPQQQAVQVEYQLAQNYPNPFNSITTIAYQLPEASKVELSVYSITGQLIITLVNEYNNAGYYSVKWNASGVGSGLYLYRIKTGKYINVKKCLVIK